MSKEYIWIVILLIALASYLPRVIPLVLLSGRGLPHWFKVWLTFVPTAIFGSLVFPDILLINNELNFSHNNIALWTTVLITPIALKTKSLGYTIIAGALVFAVLQKTL